LEKKGEKGKLIIISTGTWGVRALYVNEGVKNAFLLERILWGWMTPGGGGEEVHWCQHEKKRGKVGLLRKMG